MALLDVPLPSPVRMALATAAVLAPSGSAGSVATGVDRGKYGEVVYTSACMGAPAVPSPGRGVGAPCHW